MNIGISLHSTREVLFLFSSPLLNHLKEDRKNQYIIFMDDPDRLESLISGYDHIQVKNYYLGTKFRKALFYILIQPYERMMLLNKKIIGDHSFSIKETWSFDKLSIILGYIFLYTPYFGYICNLFRHFSFKTSYYDKYKIESWLITEYHHYKEKVISFNYGNKTAFFPSSHDSYTIDGHFSHEINKYFVWTSQDKKFAIDICNLPQEKIIESGNPYLERIKDFKYEGKIKNKVLFLGSNNFVYNETDMVKELKENTYLNKLGISLRISPGVNGVGKEWHRRKDIYESVLGEDNVLMPSGEWFGENFHSKELNESYYSSLYQHEIFIVPGVSNIAYDVLARNGVLVLMFYKGKPIKNRFPWWSCKSREVLDHMKSEPNVLVCESAFELEEKLKDYFLNNSINSNNTYTKDLKSSQIIYNELIK